MANNTRWTNEEVSIVKNNYHIIDNDAIALLLPLRSIKAINHRAAKLNICHKLRQYHQNDNYFNKHTYVGTSYHQSIRQRDGVFIVEYGGRLQMRRICDWLYKNSNDDIRLDRKYQKVGQ